MSAPNLRLREVVKRTLNSLEQDGGLVFAWDGDSIEMGMQPAGNPASHAEAMTDLLLLLKAARQQIDFALAKLPQVDVDPKVRHHRIDINP